MGFGQQGCTKSRKGANIWMWIWYVVGFLILVSIGNGACEACGACGGEGCGACVEMCDGDSSSGSGENCGEDCEESCDSCVQSEGIDCGDKEGCFACAGCGDCSECGGTTVYRITLDIDGVSVELKLHTLKTDIPIYYPDGQGGYTKTPSAYHEFLGYYDGGTCYVDSEGHRVRELKKDLKLVAKYGEKNEGDEYQISFNTTKPDGTLYFDTPAPITVYVGDEMYGFPVAPDIDGYEFVGWFTEPLGSGRRAYTNDSDLTFHLSTVGVSPDDTNTYITLYAHYTQQTYTVTFHGVGGSVAGTAQVTYGQSLAQAFEQIQFSYDENSVKFFGWSYRSDADPETETIDLYSSYVTEQTTHVYAITRRIVTFVFHTGRGGASATIQLYETQTNVDLNNYESVKYIMTDPRANPGYSFKWWAKDANGTYEATAIQGTYIQQVTSNMQTTYYAGWTEETYNIMYYLAYDGMELSQGSTTYTYALGCAELKQLNEHPTLGRFLGWLVQDKNGNWLSTTPVNSLSANVYYGDLKLYAKYENS